MKLQFICIWISLFTLVGISQTGYAADPSEPQAKATIALIGTGDFGNSLGSRLAELGYPIVYGSRNPESDKVKELLKMTGHGSTATTQKEAAQQDAGPLHMARNIEAMMMLYYVPHSQGRETGWEFYFRRINYWMCNKYIPEGGVEEEATAASAPDVADIPDIHGPPELCP